ncbi:MAG TPA: hypothetical protein VFI73_08640 [Candidatus Nitrosopolaris sp.]|nr:hypothetical protein [Candidatus Nitrosopolaris sp.]
MSESNPNINAYICPLTYEPISITTRPDIPGNIAEVAAMKLQGLLYTSYIRQLGIG